MPVNIFRETRDSRPFDVGGTSPTATLKYMALRSDDEGEVLQKIRDEAPLVFSGLFRQSAKATPLGGGVWSVDVEYSIPTDGTNLSDLPAQGGETDPPEQAEPNETAPLGPEWSFTTTGGSKKITQSKLTVSKTAAAGVARDFKQAINATTEGVEGTEVNDPVFEFSYTRKFASITLKYLRKLKSLTGTVNNATFLTFAAGELLFLGSEASYKTGDGWSVTFKFAAKDNMVNVDISPAIRVPAVKGWEYLWVAYTKEISEGYTVNRPQAAYVEKVYEYTNFRQLGI